MEDQGREGPGAGGWEGSSAAAHEQHTAADEVPLAESVGKGRICHEAHGDTMCIEHVVNVSACIADEPSAATVEPWARASTPAPPLPAGDAPAADAALTAATAQGAQQDSVPEAAPAPGQATTDQRAPSAGQATEDPAAAPSSSAPAGSTAHTPESSAAAGEGDEGEDSAGGEPKAEGKDRPKLPRPGGC